MEESKGDSTEDGLDTRSRYPQDNGNSEESKPESTEEGLEILAQDESKSLAESASEARLDNRSRKKARK